MKQWERAAAFGVAALLFVTTGNVQVFAQQTTAENAAKQQGVLQYLYVEEQTELAQEDQKILVQLVPRQNLPETAQLQYHIVQTGERKTIDALQIQDNAFLFAPEPKTERQKQLLELTLQPQTMVLDSVTWTEGDTRYRFDFAKLGQEISYTTAKQETEDTSVVYTENGQSVVILNQEEEAKDTTTDDMTRILQSIEAALSAQETTQPESTPKPEQEPQQEPQQETAQTSENEQQDETIPPSEVQPETQPETQPTENTTVAVQDEITYTGGELFADVKSSHWFYPSVSYVMNKGLMTGMMDGNFAPSASMTRAQFAVILYRMEGAPEIEVTSSYTDVPKDAFYTKAILWAEQEGLLSGVDATTMQPQAQMTREQMVSVLYRYAQSQGFDTSETVDLSIYADAEQISPFAKDAMAWAVEIGLIAGEGEQQSLSPKNAASRAVCAAMITRFCEIYVPDKYPNIPIYVQLEDILVGETDPQTGTFWITATGLKATMDVAKVEAVTYCTQMPQERVMQVMQQDAQDTDVYATTDNIKNHKMQYGTYQVQIYVTLSNGIRILAGTQSAEVKGTEAQMRISKNINAVYDQVGTDLYACYQWVAQNVSYQTLPIPLEPPTGYTADQWYAIQAFEQRKGNCFCYAGAFYHLAKGLGYDAKYVEGKVAMAAGGYGPHGWVEITINGATYICDPDMQREAPRYNFYMQPVGSPVIRYIR